MVKSRFDGYERPTKGKEDVTQVEDVNYEALLDILKEHVISYPTLLAFYGKNILLPANVLTPKGFDIVIDQVDSDSIFLMEILTFIDTLSLLDILHFGADGTNVFDLFTASIRQSRSSGIGNSTLVMSEGGKDRGVLSRNADREFGLDSILENRAVVGFYIFSLVCHLYNIDPFAI